MSQLLLLSESLNPSAGQEAVQTGVGVHGAPPTVSAPPVQSIPPPPFTPGATSPTDFSRFREATPRPQRPSRNRDSARHGSRSHGASRGGATRPRSPPSRTHQSGRSRDDQGGRPSKYRRGGEAFYSDESGSSSAHSSSSSGASRHAPSPPQPQLDMEVTFSLVLLYFLKQEEHYLLKFCIPREAWQCYFKHCQSSPSSQDFLYSTLYCFHWLLVL